MTDEHVHLQLVLPEQPEFFAHRIVGAISLRPLGISPSSVLLGNVLGKSFPCLTSLRGYEGPHLHGLGRQPEIDILQVTSYRLQAPAEPGIQSIFTRGRWRRTARFEARLDWIPRLCLITTAVPACYHTLLSQHLADRGRRGGRPKPAWATW